MDVRTFQRKYHDYAAANKAEALDEIRRMEIVEGHMVVPVEFPTLGWAIMLDTAAEEIRRLGII